MIDIRGYASLLREILQRQPGDPNDFVSLAVTGETLRRALAAADEPVEEARAALDAYDAALPAWKDDVPTDIPSELDEALEELRACAESLAEDLPASFPALVGRVDELLAVAVAGVRAGALEQRVADELAQRARDEVGRYAANAPALWQPTEDRSAWLGTDPDYPGAYRWLEELARYSASRRALEAGPPLFDADERKGILERFLRKRADSTVGASGDVQDRAAAWQMPDVADWVDSLAAQVAAFDVDAALGASSTGAENVALAAPPPDEETDVGQIDAAVVLEGGRRGAIARLRIRRVASGESRDPWKNASNLRSVARDALRAAFLCAARQMPWKLAPCPFDDHVFELETPDGVDAIDGPSLGLPAALAFVSLWSGRACEPYVLATGRVDASRCEVLPVGGVGAKAAAARALGTDARLIVPRDDRDQTEGVGLAVDDVEGALEHAGLEAPSGEDYEPWLGDISEREALLEKMSRQVENQAVGEYAQEGDDPWLVLADRMRAVLTSIEAEEDLPETTRKICARARSLAALAYSHAADPASANTVLGGAPPSDDESPAVRLLRSIVELSGKNLPGLRGTEPSDEEKQLYSRIDELLPRVEGPDRRVLEGQALGTQGRFLMHHGRIGEALPLLEKAVDHHDLHAPQQSPRSRVYLAMALRMDDRVDQAFARLLEARDRLREVERYSAEYAVGTRIYVEYELARAFLKADLAGAASVAARHADQLARARGLHWPRPGILRTLAWAQKAQDRSADAVMRELERLVASGGIFQVFLDEARGERTDEGEVY